MAKKPAQFTCEHCKTTHEITEMRNQTDKEILSQQGVFTMTTGNCPSCRYLVIVNTLHGKEDLNQMSEVYKHQDDDKKTKIFHEIATLEMKIEKIREIIEDKYRQIEQLNNTSNNQSAS